LCPRTADAAPFEVPIRPWGEAGSADQVAVLAKLLFTNSFQAVCRMASKSRNQVRPGGFPKD